MWKREKIQTLLRALTVRRDSSMRRRPDKVTILQDLKAHGFKVPDFIYVPAEDLQDEHPDSLSAFLDRWKADGRVIVRSAHPLEAYYKGGTFDSLEATADPAGVRFAWRKMVRACKTTQSLSIRRQQVFNGAPPIDPDMMGVMVMPLIEGQSIMAKIIGESWEFGYCSRSDRLVSRDPFLTLTPHDGRLLEVSQAIAHFLGFRCEIEFVQSEEGAIFVVQARDISHVPTTEDSGASAGSRVNGNAVRLDGVYRIRSRSCHRERPLFFMDNHTFFLDVIDACEEHVDAVDRSAGGSVNPVLEVITRYEREMEQFALSQERYAVLGTRIHVPELYPLTHHCLETLPDSQKVVADALRQSQYALEYFLAEADTLIAKDRIRFNLCTHNAYGISTVQNPLWTVFWNEQRDDAVLKAIRSLGFRTGDAVHITIDTEGIPRLRRV